tara:strand:- start:243 stop:521 length:279 start_codon:yes stop_codon:yes gene_type:complete
VGVEPYAKNIGRKEYNGLKGYIARKKYGKKIQYKISGELGPLAYQTIQHTLSRFVDEVFFRIVEIVDDISCRYDQGRTEHDNEQVAIKNNFS